MNLFPIIFAVVGCLVIIRLVLHFQRRAEHKRMDFNWYSKEFPDLITPHGVKCFKCGSEHMVVKNVMRHFHTKAHSCGRCGQALYYSPER